MLQPVTLTSVSCRGAIPPAATRYRGHLFFNAELGFSSMPTEGFFEA